MVRNVSEITNYFVVSDLNYYRYKVDLLESIFCLLQAFLYQLLFRLAKFYAAVPEKKFLLHSIEILRNISDQDMYMVHIYMSLYEFKYSNEAFNILHSLYENSVLLTEDNKKTILNKLICVELGTFNAITMFPHLKNLINLNFIIII